MRANKIDIVNIGNVIMDILIKVTDEDIEALDLAKGIMHLVSVEEQKRILDYFQVFEKELEIGGSGPNVVRCASLLGNQCCLIGQVASDEFGEKYHARVNDLGIINRIGTGATGVTGSSVVLVTEDGQRTMNTCLGNSCTYTLTNEMLEDIKRSGLLFWISP